MSLSSILGSVQLHILIVIGTFIAYAYITKRQPTRCYSERGNLTTTFSEEGKQRKTSFAEPLPSQRTLVEPPLRRPLPCRPLMQRMSTSNIPRLHAKPTSGALVDPRNLPSHNGNVRNHPSSHGLRGVSTGNLLRPRMIRSDPGPSRMPSSHIVHPRSVSFSEDVRDADDMTLAQRRDLLMRRDTILRRPTQQVPSMIQSASTVSIQCHRLERHDSKYDQVKSEARFAKWRECMTHADGPQQQQVESDEAMRIAMIEDRREAELMCQQKERDAMERENIIDARMRTKIMLGLHRKALSALQRSVRVDEM